MVAYAVWRGWGSYVRSKRQHKNNIYARVKDKQGTQEFDPVTWQHEHIQKVLVFECEDGIIRDYEVHDDIWDWTEPGDDGMLTYQGELFVSFENRRPRHDVDKVYKTLTRG